MAMQPRPTPTDGSQGLGLCRGEGAGPGAPLHIWQHRGSDGNPGRDPLPRVPGEHPGLAAGWGWEPRVRSRSQGSAIVSCQPAAVSVFIFANMTQLKGNRICTFHLVSGPGNAVRGMGLT